VKELNIYEIKENKLDDQMRRMCLYIKFTLEDKRFHTRIDIEKGMFEPAPILHDFEGLCPICHEADEILCIKTESIQKIIKKKIMKQEAYKRFFHKHRLRLLTLYGIQLP